MTIRTLLLTLSFLGAQSAPVEVPAEAPGQARGDAGPKAIQLHRVADGHLVAGQYREAQLAFARALATSPGDPTLTYGLACALARLGKIDEALDAVKAAVDAGYGDPSAVYRDDDLRKLRMDQRLNDIVPRHTTKPGGDSVAWTFGPNPEDYALIPCDPPLVVHSLGDGSLEFRSAATGEPTFAAPPADAPVASLGSNRSGTKLAVLFADGQMMIIHPAAGESTSLEPAKGVQPAYWVSRLQFAAEGRFIIAWTNDGALKWSCDGPFLGSAAPLAKGARFRTSDLASSSWIPQLSGAYLRLHSLIDSELPPRDLPFDQSVTGVEFSPSGRLIAVGTNKGGLHLVDAESGSIAWSQVMTDDATGSPTDIFGTPLKVSTLCFDPSGKRLAVCTTTGYFVGVFDVATGKRLWRTGHLGGRMGGAMSLMQSPELVVGDQSRHVWDGETGRAIDPIGARRPDNLGVPFALLQNDTFSASEKILARSDTKNGRVRWRFTRPQRVPYLVRHPAGWVSGSFDPAETAVDPRAYDPKRLRLATKGLRLSPPSLD